MDRQCDSFNAEYGGPTSFYSFINRSQSISRCLLRRNVRWSPRSKRVKILSFKFNPVFRNIEHRIIFGAVSIQFQDLNPLSTMKILGTLEYKHTNFDRTEHVMSLMCNTTTIKGTLLIVACLIEDDNQNPASRTVSECVGRLFGPSSCRFSPKFGVVELLPLCSSSGRSLHNETRSAFIPGCVEEFIFLPLYRNGRYPQRTNERKDLGLTLMVKWFNATERKKVHSLCQTRNSSDSSSYSADSSSSSSAQRLNARPVFYHYTYWDSEIISPPQMRNRISYYDGLVCPWCSGCTYITPLLAACSGKGEHVVEENSQNSGKRPRDLSSDSVNNGNRKRKAKSSSISVSTTSASCLWTLASRRALSALVIHLRTFHSHFRYEYAADMDGGLHIIVSRPRNSDDDPGGVASRGREGAIFFGGSWRGMLSDCEEYVAQCPEITTQALSVASRSSDESQPKFISHAIPDHESLYNNAEGMKEANDGSSLNSNNPTPARQYYHCNGFPVAHTEDTYDSDKDISSDWILQQSEDMIDEYVDVISLKEKKFMKLWNAFVHSFPVFADGYVASAAKVFARRFAPYIVNNQMRHLLLLHLITLWDFSVVCVDDVVECIAIVDTYKAATIELNN